MLKVLITRKKYLLHLYDTIDIKETDCGYHFTVYVSHDAIHWASLVVQ